MNRAQSLAETLLAIVPADGSAIGNQSLRQKFSDAAVTAGQPVAEADFERLKEELVASGVLVRGKGRGGPLRRASVDGEAFGLAVQAAPAVDAEKTRKTAPAAPRVKSAGAGNAAQIVSYRHRDKRVNNPEVGMVTPATDPEEGKFRWAYDPHIDPALQFDPGRAAIEALIDDALGSGDADEMRAALEELKRRQSPYLNWAGKAERTSFDVDTVSLHVHERIDPASILSAVRKRMQDEKTAKISPAVQPGLFDAPFENLPLHDAIDFYRHERGWANRLVAGDSLLVMNSLLQKESLAGRVQMIYIDPPYGIKYGSNFQPFVGKRDVKDRNDADLTQEPEMIKAFRDTWELGIHSYLTYLRDRLLLARELMHESGSVFVQISDENLHHVREIMDETFGAENSCSVIPFAKTSGQTPTLLATVTDFLVWYAKDKNKIKFNALYTSKEAIGDPSERYVCVETPQGSLIDLSYQQKATQHLPEGEILRLRDTTSQSGGESSTFEFQFWGKELRPSGSRGWSTNINGLTSAAVTLFRTVG